MECPPIRIPWWGAPAAVLLLLVVLALLLGPPPEVKPAGSSYDASPKGVRAAFLLLRGLGYDVEVSRRLGGGRVRWLLFPSKGSTEVPGLVRWVEAGGVLLLADDEDHFLARLPREGGEEWPRREGRPLATVHRHGRGEIWLVHRPEIFRNEKIREGNNARDVCRLAGATGGRGPILFDEYFHGLRDRPDVVGLLLQPPTLWVTLQGAALLALGLWRYLPRFGAVQHPRPPRRRSKGEFLEAMAGLLERKRAYETAFLAARDALTRDLEDALGLPPGTPPDRLAEQAAARFRRVDRGRLKRALAPAQLPRAGGPAFLRAVNDIEDLRHDCFDP